MRLLSQSIDMYRYPVQSYVLQPIETVANEVSMYIYIYVPEQVGASRAWCWLQRIWGENDINTVQFLAQTDCFVSLDLDTSSRAAGFNLVLSVYVFLTLKAMEPIHFHYMTDRLS